jgi:phage terminase large subunit-like protein
MEVSKTLSARAKTHGDYYTRAKIVQTLKDVFAHSQNWDELPDDMKQSLDMIADKISRILHGDYNFADTWHDISGYARLVEDRLEPDMPTIDQQIAMVWGAPAEEVTDE